MTEAIYGAGYQLEWSLLRAIERRAGHDTDRVSRGGANTEIRFAIGECSLGSILVAASERGVCAILIGDDPDALARDLQDRFPRAHLIGGDAQFEQLVAKVVGFVEAPALGLDLPLDVRGTAFQQRVWQALREIPVGHRQRATRRSPIASARQRRCVRWVARSPPIQWRWRSRAIA